ncbi:putative S-layer protein [Synechococcus sp. PCC 7502]|uniref:S-layer homology domain-containing protein n=1 Tax=Synechococcus sp. PCC 7502 TaxID=1173263 RepID=UPI00029F80BF|nr:S-layer homology domain-containing protein [Synechococcus sp. PCC 7502]AFY72589.1 putative S-layer protein [Synechococcus sp. PCC 7502]
MNQLDQLRRISIYLCLIIASITGLSACKGTGIGTTVEGAIAPTARTVANSSPVEQTLPKDFSSDIPIYPQAVLQKSDWISTQNISANISAHWITADSVSQVSKFYDDAFTKQQWRVILRSPDGNFVVQKSDLLVTLSIQSLTTPANTTNSPSAPENSPANSTTSPSSTHIFLQYLRDPQLNTLNTQINKNIDTSTPAQVPSTATQTNQVNGFSDIETLSEALRSPITDLQKLGTITAKVDNQFKPNDLIQKREYARWLVNTNNRLYASRPTRQIRLADANSTPVFVDIPPSDPDFPVIQALANVGLIPTDPSVANTSRRFRPNDPISREMLLQWKIPLDIRAAIPAANLESVKQAWGFQDSDRISPISLKFVLADFKLGDLSNIRRSFGYTTLFQPQKNVTRAEAAVALWYFGTPEDGLSAQNALESTLQPSPQPTPTSSPTLTPAKPNP